MDSQKQYSIRSEYWTLSLGFGIAALIGALVLLTKYPIVQFLENLYRAFPKHPVEVIVFGSGLGLVLLTLVFLIYIPFRGFLIPRRVQGTLQDFTFDQQDSAGTIRVSGEIVKIRFSHQAIGAFRSSIGKPIRITLGAFGTVLSIELA